MDDSPATRYTLIVKLRDPADAEAWREFLTIYEPLVYRLARHKGLQDADARDLCQDVFRAVSRAIDRWEPDPNRGTFRGWLFTIARRLLINFLTRQDHPARGTGDSQMLARLSEIADSEDPEASAIFDHEHRQRLFRWAADQVKGEFSATTWQAFWRTAVEGLPVASTATECGISVGAVYIARSRVLARLRQRLDQLGDSSVTFLGECHGRPA